MIDFSPKAGFAHRSVVTLAVTPNFTFHRGGKRRWGGELLKAEAYEKEEHKLLEKLKNPQHLGF